MSPRGELNRYKQPTDIVVRESGGMTTAHWLIFGAITVTALAFVAFVVAIVVFGVCVVAITVGPSLKGKKR